jgi:hypothetical protein
VSESHQSGPPPRQQRLHTSVAALGLLALCLATSAYSLRYRCQLEDKFVNDEWFLLGSNLLAFHTVGIGSFAIVLRPPGYPALIATALATLPEIPGAARDPATAGDLVALKEAYGDPGFDAVFRIQALLLALTAVALFLWLGRRIAPRSAFLAGLLFGTNPYALVLVGVLNYSVLHMFFLVVGCLFVDWATDPPWKEWRIAAAGAWWGLSALVRPVTLPLSLFLFPFFLLRSGRDARRAFVGVLVFTAAAAVTVAPWTVRNYRLTGRFIPTNAQMWVTLWGQTLRPLPFDPNHSLWRGVATSAEFRTVYLRATGKEPYDPQASVHNNRYDYGTYVRANVEIEDAFRADALANLRRQPWVYAYNCGRSFLSLNLQMNSVMIRLFRHLQRGQRIPKGWFLVGNTQESLPSTASRVCDGSLGLLSLCALAGAAVAVWRRETAMLVPAAVYLCMAAAHAMIWVDLRYYYLKLPFLFVFAFYAVDRLWAARPGGAGRFGSFAVPVLAALSVLSTLSVLSP